MIANIANTLGYFLTKRFEDGFNLYATHAINSPLVYKPLIATSGILAEYFYQHQLNIFFSILN